MGTKSLIRIEGIEYAQVYKHWDGHPDHMIPWLTAFNQDFTAERGIDAAYKFAQLLRFAALNAEEYNLDKSKYTGWGLVDYNQEYDANYIFTLKHNGTVTVKTL